MEKRILAILDSEEKYAYGLTEYMSEKPVLPFRIHMFTDKERFISYSKGEDIECLLVTENLYNQQIDELDIPHIIILSETGKVINQTLLHVNKYQSVEYIFREILQYFSEYDNSSSRQFRLSRKKMKVIGVYTPLGRCLQTTFSITLGQLLSKRGKTLYLNFERYSGLSKMMRREFNSDISDLMYYFECAKEKLTLRIESIVENVNGMDFIPPAQIYQSLAGIKGEQWLDLMGEIEKCTDYEYLILDLTDGVLDLWDILRFCDVVYTISRKDPLALAKIEQYEKALHDADYKDVLSKTQKYGFPQFHDLPYDFDELTKTELAIFVKDKILPNLLKEEE
ncbi:MAG: hypothetical protein MJ133_02795 [Lachnospiraceae bacterium]|nr:hypothetical protein [Lachnospiraceae bacterium]